MVVTFVCVCVGGGGAGVSLYGALARIVATVWAGSNKVSWNSLAGV